MYNVAAAGATDRVQIYARARDGVLREARALRPDCPVTGVAPLRDLGDLPARDSVALLSPLLYTDTQTESAVRSHAMASVAVHAGEAARAALLKAAAPVQPAAVRRDAVFWMGQVRGADCADEIKRLMADDADAELRTHAAFALSQSSVADKAGALIRQGRTDTSARVRAQAWFWLAQTQSAQSEAAIGRAIAEDRAAAVREQAVFALSQLPGERATDALIGVAQDTARPAAVRKQALFWLARSESPRAAAYLDRVLTP
jgi:HEAT repeat protein